MDSIMEDLEDLENMDAMRKVIDDLNYTHGNLSNEKYGIYEVKTSLNWLASATINGLEKLSDMIENKEDENLIKERKLCIIRMLQFSNESLDKSIDFIVENFEEKLFGTLLNVELKEMILKDDVKDYLKAKEDLDDDKDKLMNIARRLSEEIRNAYQFLRHEFILINMWKNWVEEVEGEMTRPDDAFKAMIDDRSCDSKVFDYTMISLASASDNYRNHAMEKLFL